MFNEELLQKKIDFYPHKGQLKVLKSKGREVVICAGRRWGKSAVCGYLVVRTFLKGVLDIKNGKRKSVKIWIVAPTYDLSKKVFDYVVTFLLAYDNKFARYIKDRPYPSVRLSHNVWIECKSADNPKGLLGEELDFLVLDEAANVSKVIWYDYLMPTTAAKDRNCRTIFISTPRGKNWFYELYMRAKDKKSAFHFTSLDGESITQKEWERLKVNSPKDYFSQNYEATFLDNAVSVFRKVRDIIGNPEQGAKVYHRYVIGVDLAQIEDFTVLTVIDRNTHEVVEIDRFNKISYPLQTDRIEALASRYNGAKVIIELNAIGIAIADELRARTVNVQDFKTAGTISSDIEKRGSKERMINKLAVDIENRNLTIPDNKKLIDELEAYAYEISRSGNYKYGAPEGYHDDMVISLALANWALKGKTKKRNIMAAKSIPHQKKVFQYN